MHHVVVIDSVDDQTSKQMLVCENKLLYLQEGDFFPIFDCIVVTDMAIHPPNYPSILSSV
ncbi:hypothetical protein T4E_12324 [Trichinella pseudospiralis]|uniref:Uncharacterized protein n=1 Tax=Trichinella pseudospiralis TaxID=6337 RepID=A0A0V0Y6S0_TRIPS|nr:hypothetical protein T4E_12324 [Trichinella pseudospiralis]KRY84657.1 hypothetical protein T4D_17117 [Trichinella pseudospiralis]KRY84687.1 hypothetical protein T4D_7598 [Trichinella pseudospiralis]